MEQKNTTISLAGTTEVDENALYFIDFSKLQRIEDLILILAAIGFTFSPKHPHWNLLQQFMNLGQPVYPQQAQQQMPELKLPKLNPLKKDGE